MIAIFDVTNMEFKDAGADVKSKMKYPLDDGTRPYSYGYPKEGIKGEGGAYIDKVNISTVQNSIFPI